MTIPKFPNLNNLNLDLQNCSYVHYCGELFSSKLALGKGTQISLSWQERYILLQYNFVL